MRLTAEKKRIVIAVVATLAAVVLAFAGYGLYQKRAVRAQVAQTVDAASARLSAALGGDLAAPTAALAEQLERSVEETDGDLARLRGTRARSERALVEAADAYVGNVLAVLKRQSGIARGRLKFVDSRNALAEHMAQVGQRGDGWIESAIRLKKRMDGDYFEYHLAAGSLDNMLGELPGARSRMAALLPQARLPDEGAIREARARSLAAAEATRRDYEQAKQLVPR